MSGKGEKITTKTANIYRHMGNGLCTINEQQDTVVLADLCNFGNWRNDTDNIRSLADSNEPC